MLAGRAHALVHADARPIILRRAVAVACELVAELALRPDPPALTLRHSARTGAARAATEAFTAGVVAEAAAAASAAAILPPNRCPVRHG